MPLVQCIFEYIYVFGGIGGREKSCSVCSVQIVVNQKGGDWNVKNLKNLSGNI